jgi:5-methylcytosine-specific restriction endonuclease McrA
MAKSSTSKATAKLPRWARGECPAATRTGVIARDGACVYCRAAANLTVDHIVPVSVAIDHRPTNLVAACWTCNHDRGVIDADLYCMHIARRTGESWRTIWARVRAARRTAI